MWSSVEPGGSLDTCAPSVAGIESRAKHRKADTLLRPAPLELIELRTENVASSRMQRPKKPGIYLCSYTPWQPGDARYYIDTRSPNKGAPWRSQTGESIHVYGALAVWLCNYSIV